MSKKQQRRQAVRDRALSLKSLGIKETFDDLGAWLNAQGIRTDCGLQYSGGRGVARVVMSVWEYFFYTLKDTASADVIAYAFTDKNGKYAYK